MGTVDREGDPLNNNATLQWLQQLKPRAVHLLKIGGRVVLKWISLKLLFFPRIFACHITSGTTP